MKILTYLSFLVIFISSFPIENNDYPNITMTTVIIDKATKDTIKEDVHIVSEIYHDYTECRHEMAAINLIEYYKKDLILEVDSIKRIKIEQSITRLKRQIYIDKELAKYPYIDKYTIREGRQSIAFGFPLKKYSIIFIHPDYETLTIQDSFEVCSFGAHITANMVRKK